MGTYHFDRWLCTLEILSKCHYTGINGSLEPVNHIDKIFHSECSKTNRNEEKRIRSRLEDVVMIVNLVTSFFTSADWYVSPCTPCIPLQPPPLSSVVHLKWSDCRMQSRAYVSRTIAAKTRPKLDKHINMSGTPTIAYAIVTILPSTVFGVKLPYPVKKILPKNSNSMSKIKVELTIQWYDSLFWNM